MKGIVRISFVDKLNPDVVYKVGEIVRFEKARMANLVQRGLVEIVEEAGKKRFRETLKNIDDE